MSPSAERGLTLPSPWLPASPFHTRGGEASRDDRQCNTLVLQAGTIGGSAAVHPSPHLPTSPSSGVEGRVSRLAGYHSCYHTLPALPTTCLPASPSSGVEGQVSRLAGYQSHHPTLPALPSPCLNPHHTTSSPPPPHSSSVPFWASAVGEGLRASPPQPATAADFISLYHRCVPSGLCTSVNFNNISGCEEIFVTCCLTAPLPTSITTTSRRPRQRHRVCRVTATTAGKNMAPPSPSPFRHHHYSSNPYHLPPPHCLHSCLYRHHHLRPLRRLNEQERLPSVDPRLNCCGTKGM
jgi:hypothetical protein